MLLLKLLLAPGLVALVTLAVRRWGPAVGGWLAGLPIVAGPVLVFYALEQGHAFAARAAHATLAGLIATVAFAVTYAVAARPGAVSSTPSPCSKPSSRCSRMRSEGPPPRRRS